MGKLSHLIEFKEDIGIQDIFSVTTIEPFNRAVLHGASRLGILSADLLIFCSWFKVLAGVLRSIVYPDNLGFSSLLDDLFQYSDDSFSG